MGFSTDSSYDFTVSPTSGILPPCNTTSSEMREDGALISISFTAVEYGKYEHGTLIIETEEKEWRYEIKGIYPGFEAPEVSPKVDSWLDKSINEKISHLHPPKNHIKLNTTHKLLTSPRELREARKKTNASRNKKRPTDDRFKRTYTGFFDSTIG